MPVTDLMAEGIEVNLPETGGKGRDPASLAHLEKVFEEKMTVITHARSGSGDRADVESDSHAVAAREVCHKRCYSSPLGKALSTEPGLWQNVFEVA